MLKSGRNNRLTWFAMLLTTTCAQAGIMGTDSPAKDDYFEVSAAGGVNWYNVPDTNLVISPYETNSERVNPISADGAWKVGVGYYFFENLLKQQHYFNHLLFEMNVYQTFASLSGSVWQYGLPEFYNYNFKTPVTSTRLMIDVKPTFFTWGRFSPFAILGVGADWNTLSYNETVTGADIDPASALSLSKNTSTQVAWDVGAGFSVTLTDHMSATAEYIYAFLGNGSPAHAMNISSAPNFSLQTQNLLVGLRLIF